ncbi:hypothetical protein LINPERHAP1_LOCUS42619, partial [Linum perenne]
RLPIHYFNRLAVTHIGNCIGKTAKLDLTTSKGARARYARVCVEADISKPLLGKYMIQNHTFFIEYESLENIYVTCGFYGHKTDACTSPKTVETSPGAETSPGTEMSHNTHSNGPKAHPAGQEGDAGVWMVVQRRNRGKAQKDKQEPPKKPPPEPWFVPMEGSKDTQFKDTQSKDVPPPKETDATIVALAASLAAALSKAPNLYSEAGSSAGAVSKHRAPLADLTNEVNGRESSVLVTLLQKTASSKNTKLVTVPVVYDNPMFLGKAKAASAPKVKKQVPKRDKIGVTRDRPTQSKKGLRKDGKQVRSFTSRQVPAKENLNADGEAKVGEPLDRS